MPLLVLKATGSATRMGVVLGISLAFQLVGGVAAGPVVDRFDRRTLLVICDVAQFVLVGLIPLLWWTMPAHLWTAYGIWIIYAVVGSSSFAVTLSMVALRAFMPQMVGRGALVTANGRMITLGEIAYGVGPAIAGLVVAAVGEANAIGVNALTFGVSAAAWMFVRPLVRGVPPAGTDTDTADRAPHSVPLSGRMVGLRYVWSIPIMRSLFVLELFNKLLVAGTTVLFIYYLRVDLGASSAGVGLLLSLASGGAVLAAVTTKKLRTMIGPGRAWLVGVAVQGAALTAVSLSGAIWAVAILAVVFGYGQIVSAILGTTMRQEYTRDAVLGRVTAAVLTAFVAAQAVGGVLTPGAADIVPTSTVFIVIGVLNLAIVGCGLRTAMWRQGAKTAESADADRQGATDG